MDHAFLILIFVAASGLVTVGGFLIACVFVLVTEGKHEARKFFWSEWNGRQIDDYQN